MAQFNLKKGYDLQLDGRPNEEDITIVPTLDLDLSEVEDGDVIYKKPAEIIRFNVEIIY